MPPASAPPRLTDVELERLHRRLAVRFAVVLLPTVFIVGIIAGTAARLWTENRGAAVLVAALAIWVVAWLTFAYYRTDGLLDHTGFRAGEGPRLASRLIERRDL